MFILVLHRQERGGGIPTVGEASGEVCGGGTGWCSGFNDVRDPDDLGSSSMNKRNRL